MGVHRAVEHHVIDAARQSIPLHRVPILAIIDSVEFVGRDALDRADGKALALAIAKCGRAAQTRIRNQSERVATPDYVICLEDSKKFKSLKRHLASHCGLHSKRIPRKVGIGARLSDGCVELRGPKIYDREGGWLGRKPQPTPTRKGVCQTKPRLSEGSLSVRQPQARCQRQLAIRTVGQAILVPSDLRLRLRAMLSIADSRRVLLR